MMALQIEGSKFAVVSNGFVDGPAQALRDYLLAKGAGLTLTVFHPLLREGRIRHEITRYDRAREPVTHEIILPFHPPLTYPLDLLVPLLPARVDAWFGFNNLACLRGMVAKRLGRAGKAYYWCVDFVPNRFGIGIATKAYDALDRYVCRKADARIELSQAALAGRNQRIGIGADNLAPSYVIPMGAWLERVPITPDDAFRKRVAGYMGHLVPRQGVRALIGAIDILNRGGRGIRCEILGRGEEEEALRKEAADRGISHLVEFHGFVEDHRELERIVASWSVGVAPYVTDRSSFTKFADPGKLKSYLAAGLPILTTGTPPNAEQLVAEAGAEIIESDGNAIASALVKLLDAPDEWNRRRTAALQYVKRFDWNVLLDDGLGKLGYV